MRGQALLAVSALATALAVAQPASAQNYGQPYSSYHDEHVARTQDCVRVRQNRAAGGAVIGGLLGAVIGSQAGARGHRTDGSLVGAAAGALAGAAIGNSSGRQVCDGQVQGQYDPYYGQPQSYGQRGYDPRYDPRYAQRDPYDDGSGLYGGPYGRRGDRYAYRGRECRLGEIVTRDPDGYAVREQVEMCRGRDGVWRPSGRG